MANEKPLDLSTLQAGLKRYDDSLADVAKSGDYNDLVNAPSSGGGDYAEITGTPFIREDVPTQIFDITVTSSDTYRGSPWSKEIPIDAVKKIVDLLLENYPDMPGIYEDIILNTSVLNFALYVDGSRVSPIVVLAHKQTDPSPSGPRGSYYLKIYDENQSVRYCNLNFGFYRSDHGSQYDENSGSVVINNIGISPTPTSVEIILHSNSYEFSANPDSKITKLGYADAKDVPLEKTVALDDSSVSYTLTSADHIEQGQYLPDVWRQTISDALRTSLISAVESSSELSEMPTDYSMAIEIPDNVMRFNMFLNGSGTALDMTARIFKNMFGSYAIIFKYQDNYDIGDLDLSSGYINFNENYISSSSPIGINVTSVRYSITGGHVVWVPKVTSDKFDLGNQSNDEFVSIKIDAKNSASAYAANDDVILFRNFTDYCVHSGIGNKIGAKIIIGSDEYTPDSISISGSATWIIDSANLTVHMSDTTIPTGLSTAVLPQIDIRPTDPEGDLTAFNAISAGTIVQISVPAIAYAVINGKNLNNAMSGLVKTVKYTLSTQTISAGSTYAWSYNPSVPSGYTPVGVVGFTTGGAGCTFKSLYIVPNSDPIAIQVLVSNYGTTGTQQVTPAIYVLYVKSDYVA